MNDADILTVFVCQAKGGAQQFGLKSGSMPIKYGRNILYQIQFNIKIRNRNLR